MVFYNVVAAPGATTGAFCTTQGRPTHSAWVVAIMPLEKLKVLNEHDPRSFRRSIWGLDLDPLQKPPRLIKISRDSLLDIVWGGGGKQIIDTYIIL